MPGAVGGVSVMRMRIPSRRVIRWVLLGLALVVTAIALVSAFGDDGFGLIDADEALWVYVSTFLLVALDAVIPIFPGETAKVVVRVIVRGAIAEAERRA